MRAGMEAGTSRSMPSIRNDVKKVGRKTTKKRSKVEEEEGQEEVRVTRCKKSRASSWAKLAG